jgi:hypothetical protein
LNGDGHFELLEQDEFKWSHSSFILLYVFVFAA